MHDACVMAMISCKCLLLVLCLTATVSLAKYSVCPSRLAGSIHDVFGLRSGKARAQRGVSHRLQCPAFRSSEKIRSLSWLKGATIDDPNTVPLINTSSRDTGNGTSRYSLSYPSSLVITKIQGSDEGRYLCQVVPEEASPRVGAVDLKIIEDSFTASTSDTSYSASFERGRRQTLPCRCKSSAPDVVYWSLGKGFTTDTDILAARFTDGGVLQFQHGADFTIASDFSLTVNSLSSVQGDSNQRFWCHVFQLDGQLKHCYTDVQIAQDTPSFDGHALQASATSFYVRKGARQQVPCINWASGDSVCEVEWWRNDRPSRILSYDVSNNNYDPHDTFDLVSGFSLSMESVDDDIAGKFSCFKRDSVPESQGVIDVFVFGELFPLDGGSVIPTKTVDFVSDKSFLLNCSAGLLDTKTTSAKTIIWSFGAVDAKETTVIGALDLTNTTEVSGVGENSCLSILSNGSLRLNHCTQDEDVRYWCHAFLNNGVLQRSYVDIVIKDCECSCSLHRAGLAFTVIFPLTIAIVLVFGLCRWYRARKEANSQRDRGLGGRSQAEPQTNIHPRAHAPMPFSPQY